MRVGRREGNNETSGKANGTLKPEPSGHARVLNKGEHSQA